MRPTEALTLAISVLKEMHRHESSFKNWAGKDGTVTDYSVAAEVIQELTNLVDLRLRREKVKRFDWARQDVEPSRHSTNALFTKEWAGGEMLTISISDLAPEAEHTIGHRFDLTLEQEEEHFQTLLARKLERMGLKC